MCMMVVANDIPLYAKPFAKSQLMRKQELKKQIPPGLEDCIPYSQHHSLCNWHLELRNVGPKEYLEEKRLAALL